MSHVKPRKSAFSIYSENKSEVNTLVTNGNKKSKEPFHLNRNGAISKPNQKAKANKEQKGKFSKINSEQLFSSLGLLNAKQSKKQPILPQSNSTAIKANKTAKSKSPPAPKLVKDILKNEGEIMLKQLLNAKSSHHEEDEDNQSVELDQNTDPEMFDSREEAVNLLNHIISPIKMNKFFNLYWEKKPLLVQRGKPNYYKDWFSCKEFDKILRNHDLEFTQNVDVTSYINGVKQKHNPEGRAYAPLVWDFFQQGCSIRLLNPATYSKNVWKHLSLLQELFGTCVGSNTYLTPAGTQGFAPHYDDIEAFVLQLEGRKRWRVYKPLNKHETLPQFSSPNYLQSDLPEPILDVVLEAGDLLYFPRGFIHQAVACDDIHSLHITVSCYQKNSWGDFLAKLLPGAIEIAMAENIEFRRGLPIDYLLTNGVAYEEDEPNPSRVEFIEKTTSLVKKLVKYLPIDAAVDQMAKRYIHESLPPCLTSVEKNHSIHGNGECWNEKMNQVTQIAEMEPDTAIKLMRKNCLRLIVEDNSCFVYYNLNNSKIFCEKEVQYLEVDADAAPAIELLIQTYPKYLTVDELPMETIEQRITVASCLYDKGLIRTGEPLGYDSWDEDEECEEGCGCEHDHSDEHGSNEEVDEEEENDDDEMNSENESNNSEIEEDQEDDDNEEY